ncbi:MAG: beta-galactosidase, partial [Planctomycetota bacterium]
MSRVHVNDKGFWLDGQRRPIHCGELHYLRIPRPYWRDRLRKAAALGLNTVCAYIFWNAHEAQQGVFDFEGGRDVASFVR